MENYLSSYLEHFTYIGFFVVFVLGGIGLPEEVLIILAGYLVYQGEMNPIYIALVCIAGILICDYSLFYIGKKARHGFRKIGFLKRFMEPEKRVKVREYFHKYGGRTVLFVRFLPGLRVPTFLLAGSVKMNWVRFILLDFLATLITVPLGLTIGYYFGSGLEAMNIAKKTKYVAVLVVGIIIALTIIVEILVRRYLRRKNKANQP